MPSAQSEQKADKRHRHLEAGHNQAKPKALAAVRPHGPERGRDCERVESKR